MFVVFGKRLFPKSVCFPKREITRNSLTLRKKSNRVPFYE